VGLSPEDYAAARADRLAARIERTAAEKEVEDRLAALKARLQQE
jgi:hypothetical protein